MVSDYVVMLRERGWVKVPSRVGYPRGAWEYWQRWEGPDRVDWIELPHDMPVEMVYDTIARLPVRGMAVVN